MTRVYLDPAAAALEPDDRGVDPEALRSLGYLVEAGHEVVLVEPVGQRAPPELTVVAKASVESAPARPDQACWYLTRDVSNCRETSARLRTILIGAAPPIGSVRRCDAVARDVQAAVMEILAAEAMPPS